MSSKTASIEWKGLTVEADVLHEEETGPTWGCGGTPESYDLEDVKFYTPLGERLPEEIEEILLDENYDDLFQKLVGN